jgi:possible acetyltransferase
VLIAKVEDKIVGGLTAYVLPGYQTKKSSIFIYDLGVATSFQRQGIGKSLIDKLLDYAKNHQIQDVFVDTELEDNEDALAFYQKTDFDSQAKVVQYTYDC